MSGITDPASIFFNSVSEERLCVRKVYIAGHKDSQGFFFYLWFSQIPSLLVYSNKSLGGLKHLTHLDTDDLSSIFLACDEDWCLEILRTNENVTQIWKHRKIYFNLSSVSTLNLVSWICRRFLPFAISGPLQLNIPTQMLSGLKAQSYIRLSARLHHSCIFLCTFLFSGCLDSLSGWYVFLSTLILLV